MYLCQCSLWCRTASAQGLHLLPQESRWPCASQDLADNCLCFAERSMRCQEHAWHDAAACRWPRRACQTKHSWSFGFDPLIKGLSQASRRYNVIFAVACRRPQTRSWQPAWFDCPYRRGPPHERGRLEEQPHAASSTHDMKQPLGVTPVRMPDNAQLKCLLWHAGGHKRGRGGQRGVSLQRGRGPPHEQGCLEQQPCAAPLQHPAQARRRCLPSR